MLSARQYKKLPHSERRMNLAEDAATVRRLDEILKAENPCAITVKDGKATCRAGTPCCWGCKHLGAAGCTVNSVACKFFFCETAWAHLSEPIRSELRQLGNGYHGELRARHDGMKLNISKPPFVW